MVIFQDSCKKYGKKTKIYLCTVNGFEYGYYSLSDKVETEKNFWKRY